MRQPLSLALFSLLLTGCAGPLPQHDPNMAGSTCARRPSMYSCPIARMASAPTTAATRVPPGSHELEANYEFEVSGGGPNLFAETQTMRCTMVVRYDQFEAGKRYLFQPARWASRRRAGCSTRSATCWSKLRPSTAARAGTPAQPTEPERARRVRHPHEVTDVPHCPDPLFRPRPAPIRDDGTPARAANARAGAARGRARLPAFLVAEHHNMDGIASAATAVLIGYLAANTTRIRLGAGGVML